MSDVIEITEAPNWLARSRVSTYVELTKPRIAAMVLVVTAIGFMLALGLMPGLGDLAMMGHTLIGTALVAGGANALNQYLEADLDARMARTANRPLPSQRLTGQEALGFALLISVSGAVYLAWQTNLLAGAVAIVAWAVYGFVYTPLKRKTPYCVQLGAIPGALPPVIGWAAASGSVSVGAAILFAILFFWQLPHFAAIAWLYREDYDRAGYPMLPVLDPSGARTGLYMVTRSIALLAVSLLPIFHGLAGTVYAVGAAALGLAFLGCGVWFLCRRTKGMARKHLFASITYLPCLFALMVIDKLHLM